MIAILGGTGTGLVWGWYGAGIRAPRRLRSALALGSGALALVAEAAVVAGSGAATAVVAALAVGVALKVAWRAWLRRRAARSLEGGT